MADFRFIYDVHYAVDSDKAIIIHQLINPAPNATWNFSGYTFTQGIHIPFRVINLKVDFLLSSSSRGLFDRKCATKYHLSRTELGDSCSTHKFKLPTLSLRAEPSARITLADIPLSTVFPFLKSYSIHRSAVDTAPPQNTYTHYGKPRKISTHPHTALTLESNT